MTKLTNPLKSAICNRTERFSRMRRQNSPMLSTTENMFKVIRSRDLRQSNKNAVGRTLSAVDWSCLDNVVTCEEKVSIFNDIVVNTINTIMPITAKKIHINDAPWMTTKLRGLIKKRQKALNNGNQTIFKYYRNKVNLERKKCRQTYFHEKIKSLKYTKPKDWWRAVKKISGMDPTLKPDILSCLQIEEFQQLDKFVIANQINDSFLEPLQRFQALNSSNYVNASDDSNISDSNMLTVSEYEVYRCLKSLDSSKSTGPDDITSWVLKENAEVYLRSQSVKF